MTRIAMLRSRYLAAGTSVLALGLCTAAAPPASGHAATEAPASHQYLYIGGFASPAIAGAAVTHDGDMKLVPGSPFASGEFSLGMAITPDARELYSVSAGVTLSSLQVIPGTITGYHILSDGELAQFTQTTVGPAVIGAAITPDGSRLFVTTAAAKGTGGEVLSYSISSAGELTPTGAPPVSVPSSISQVVISPSAHYLFVSNYLTNNVSSFAIGRDDELTAVGSPVPAGTLPAIPAVSPDGRFLYLGNEGSGNLSGYAIAADGQLTPVPGSPYASGSTPHGAMITPDSKRVYFANASGNTTTGWQIGAGGGLTPLPGSPYQTPGVARVVLSPNARIMYAMTGAPEKPTIVSSYVVHPNGSLAPTGFPSVATGLFWHDGSNAFLTPDQAPVAAVRVVGGHGLTSTFSAAASYAPDGSVASYRWNFGDGQSQTTTVPNVTHHYSTPGQRTASVTVTDNEGCSTQLTYNGTTVECRGGPQATADVQVTVGP
jgi:6-phosphogluconolactonase (cycloisomerase 2 family)